MERKLALENADLVKSIFKKPEYSKTKFYRLTEK